EGNGTCAFVGLVAFLEANGKTLDLTPDGARDWIAGDCVSKEQIEGKLRDGHVHTKYGVPNLAEIAESVIERYRSALSPVAA
ncbi:MAG TPA: hypothetical protein VNI20_05730, partial [Fimbriimonadaceae bacterium]|nr:hypothetical protein [Fimbriimonadaceae bacterium]